MEESNNMINAAAKDDTVPAEREYQENEENVEKKGIILFLLNS